MGHETLEGTNVGCTNRMHDAKLFWRSGGFKFGQAGTLFPFTNMYVNAVSVPTVSLGPLKYVTALAHEAHPDMRAHGRRCNYAPIGCRMVIE